MTFVTRTESDGTASAQPVGRLSNASFITRVIASPIVGRAAEARANGMLGIALFERGKPDLAGTGGQIAQASVTLPAKPTVAAWDFLAIALAVTAADRFVTRSSATDGWTRMIALTVDLHDPGPWVSEARRLEAALRFLTGDIWHLHFSDDGAAPPEIESRRTDRDCICLFSGGLDSLIGAIDLVAEGRRPLLVSQASPKEGPIQAGLASELGLSAYRFEGRTSERYAPPYEPSSRARSLLFISYGVLAGDALSCAGVAPDFVHVPENGLISINPPLTRRRIGSLSTRTTHPYFISSLAAVLQRVGLRTPLTNRYQWQTKGEMLQRCLDASVLTRLATRSYSCGKGKRLNQHCGRCVPCLIRRAAFLHARMNDTTRYWAADLASVGHSDDVFAARSASTALDNRDIAQWASEAGPLPEDPAIRQQFVDVVRRGLTELSTFLGTVSWV